MLVLSHPRVRGRLQRSQFWNPHNPPSNLGALPWGGDVPDNADVDKGINGGKSTVSPLSSPEQSETENMSQGGQEDPEVIFPVPDSDEPLSTPPKPGTKPVVMCIKGKSSRPNCFNFYTLDNHADICIFCNASLLTNIRPVEHRVSGISDTRVSFDQVGDHPYCGKVIYAPKNRYSLIAMRVIKDNGHRYITKKDNTFIAIVDKNDRLLLKFDSVPRTSSTRSERSMHSTSWSLPMLASSHRSQQ